MLTHKIFLVCGMYETFLRNKFDNLIATCKSEKSISILAFEIRKILRSLKMDTFEQQKIYAQEVQNRWFGCLSNFDKLIPGKTQGTFLYKKDNKKISSQKMTISLSLWY